MKVGDKVMKIRYEYPSRVPEDTFGVVTEAFGEHLRLDPLEYRKQVCIMWETGIGEWTHIEHVELVEKKRKKIYKHTAEANIIQFLRYLETCGMEDKPFSLKEHLPRIEELLYDFHNSTEYSSGWKTYHIGCALCGNLTCRGTCFK